MNFTIRQEQSKDYETTEKVIQAAFANMEFSDKKEHEVVKRLRMSEEFIPKLSLVALDGEKIIGHILLTRINIVNENHSEPSLALAPVSVLPEYQNKGIGRKLINESLRIAKQLSHRSVVVLGHPEYYPKFGFQKAVTWGIKDPFGVPEELFMALELTENALLNVSGNVEYSQAFFE